MWASFLTFWMTTKFCLTQKPKENCLHDHIPWDSKQNRNQIPCERAKFIDAYLIALRETYFRFFSNWRNMIVHTRNLLEIILNQIEIRLYLPFFDWFGTNRTSVWFKINRKMVNTIWFRFDLLRFRKDFSVCTRG